jgi:hypothetical protein
MTEQKLNREDFERTIKELSDEYNVSIEKMVDIELKLSDSKDLSLKLLRKLYKQRKFSDPSTHSALNALEIEYNESEDQTVEAQHDHYEKLLVCFRQLQKLRQVQNNYLVGIINGLQKEVSDLKLSNGSEASKTEARVNNLQ